MAEAGEAMQEDDSGADVQVLVVDDDVHYAELTATYLERDSPFSVVTEFGGHDALDRLATSTLPDCIISDHDMPGMNGLEFLAAVREDHPELPFILYTGKGNEEIASKAVSAGVTDYVKKGGPEQYDVLANRVQNAVDRRRSQQALKEEKELLEQVLATTPGSIVCNRDGTIEYATARAARTLGTKREYMVGASWNDPDVWGYVDYDGNQLAAEDRPITHAFEQAEAVTDMPVAVEKWDGSLLYLAVDAAPLRAGGPNEVDRVVASFRDVTGQIRHERELADSRQKYHALVESLPNAVILVDDETATVVEANAKAGELFECDRDDVIGRHVTDLHPHDETDRYRRFFEDGLPRQPGAESTTRRFDDGTPVEIRTDTGTHVPVEIRGTVLELDDRTLVHGLFRDLSDETERQRELERTRTVLDAVGDATYALDEDGCFTYANDAMAELVGYPADELVGEHCSIVMGKENVEVGTELIRTLLQEDRSRGMARMTVERKDGDHVDVENHIALLPSDGRFQGTAGIARDISDRLERERRLRESEQKYASVVEEANDGIVIAQDGVLKFLNPKACDILNAAEHELLGQPVPEVVAPEDREKVADRLRRRLAGEDPERRYEFMALAVDGEKIPIEFTASVVTYEGAPAVLAICRDIGERKQRERELEQYETIVQTAPDGVFIVDEHANYIGGNMHGVELTGYTQTELMGKSVPELVEEGVFGSEVIPRYTETVTHLLSSLNDDQKGTFEFTINRDGESRIYECHVSIRPFDPDAGEEFRGSIGVLRDVTERKQRQRDLERQNERLEDFTNVIGHDLRNPLNVASGNLELARKLGDDELFDRIEDAHDRIAEILDDLLTLARTGHTVDDPESVSLHDIAEAGWATVDTEDATLKLGDDVEFDGDPGRVRQLLENLYANAVEHGSTNPRSHAHEDSVEHGSTDNRDALRLDNSVEHGTGRNGSEEGDSDGSHSGVTITVGALSDGSGFVVADDGPGIPADIAVDVFEPGFSSQTDGTGFGLAIVKEIVDAHGWTIGLGDCENGTSIEVAF